MKSAKLLTLFHGKPPYHGIPCGHSDRYLPESRVL